MTTKSLFKKQIINRLLVAFLLVIIFPLTSFSKESNSPDKEFDPGKMIMDHILDSHEWHIFTWGDFHGTIPLPVILYSPKNGLDVFMSSKFHHGKDSYRGYAYEHGHIIALEGQSFYDFSITKNVTSMMISMIFLCYLFISVARTYQRKPNSAPKGIQSLLEPIILFVRDEIAIPSIGKDAYHKYLPFLLTIFFFIWFNNLLGLVPFFPGGANVTGNIGITMVLALFTFVITTINTNKGYWVHIFNTPGVPWWLKFPIPIMPLVEFLSVFTRPFVLMVRLFANITAGHIIALVFVSIIFIFAKINIWAGYGVSLFSISFNVFMTFLELLISFIQAYVFTLLSAIYFGMAKVKDHH